MKPDSTSLKFVMPITAALIATSAYAQELTYGNGTAAYSSRDRGEEIAVSGDVTLGFENGRFDYGITFGREVGDDNGSSETQSTAQTRIGYSFSDQLYGSVDYFYINYGGNESYRALRTMAEYDLGNTTVGASYRRWNDDWTNINLYGAYEPSENVLVGLDLAQYGFSGDENRRLTATMRYDMDAIVMSGQINRDLGDSDYYNVNVIGEYALNDQFTLLGGLGRTNGGHHTENLYSAGVSYAINDDLDVTALIADARSDEHSFPGFGIALNWKLGNAPTARGRLNDVSTNISNIMWAYH